MAQTFTLPKGMRWPAKKGGGASPSQGRAKSWYEMKCPCGNLQRTELGRKVNTCAKCKQVIPGAWS